MRRRIFFHRYQRLKWRLMKYFSTISGRLFIFAALPSFLIAGALCSIYSGYLLDYHHEVFLKNGQVDFYRIESSLQYGIYTGNHGVIYKSIDRLKRPDLYNVTVLSIDNKVLFSLAKCSASYIEHLPEIKKPYLNFFTRYAQIMMPLEINTLPDFNDVDDFVDQTQALGWVIMEYDHYHFWKEYQNIFLIALMFIVQAFMLCFLLSYHVDFKLSQPITELLKGLRELKRNNFVLKLEKRSFGEMKRLQDNACKMASALHHSHETLERRVQQATSSLRESVSKIEEQHHLLEIAHKKTQEASASKSQFLAHMSHEYKTPLNSVIGFVDLMLHDQLSTTHRSYCETIKESATHLLSMINDILDLNLIEAGQLAIREKRVNLRDLIEEVIGTLSPLAQEKKLCLNYLYYQDVPEYVITDKFRIRQVLINLISNAIKYTPKGHVLVRVALELEQEEQNISHLTISVQDTGIGIDDQVQKNLFSPFCYSHQSSYHPGHSSSGLGLVITKKIIELLQGKIQYETVVDQGTKFIVQLPFHHATGKKPSARYKDNTQTHIALIDKERISPCIHHQISYLRFSISHIYHLQALANAHREYDLYCFALYHDQDIIKIIQFYKEKNISPEKIHLYSYDESLLKHALKKIPDLCHVFSLPIKSPALATHLCQRSVSASKVYRKEQNLQKVLVLDDNPMNTKLLSSLLEKYSLDVTVLNDSREFLEMMHQEHFDLIFLDIFMPYIDGITCVKNLRERKNSHLQPVVAVTANSMANDNDYLSQAGFDHVLYKPLCPQKIHEVLKRYLHIDERVSTQKLTLNSQQQWLALSQCARQVKLCFCAFYEEDYKDLGEKIHALLGIVGYHKQLEEIYQQLSHLELLLKDDTLNKKKILRTLKRLAKTVHYCYQQTACEEEQR